MGIGGQGLDAHRMTMTFGGSGATYSSSGFLGTALGHVRGQGVAICREEEIGAATRVAVGFRGWWRLHGVQVGGESRGLRGGGGAQLGAGRCRPGQRWAKGRALRRQARLEQASRIIIQKALKFRISFGT
ncbi:hypothetical protein E2562_029185 [Oryza meyeriana var. granulata]|uniref:Uncharacterized protein n=1 Tax=Oryza meyeriana var. granulata TaxID=110450 RepID=A0A6G1C0N8_9ORYZ|nr:hypothetical protein E2562_029185 [Oryza meyeriana var. granulata]